jgi:hypothetical protein
VLILRHSDVCKVTEARPDSLLSIQKPDTYHQSIIYAGIREDLLPALSMLKVVRQWHPTIVAIRYEVIGSTTR